MTDRPDKRVMREEPKLGVILRCFCVSLREDRVALLTRGQYEARRQNRRGKPYTPPLQQAAEDLEISLAQVASIQQVEGEEVTVERRGRGSMHATVCRQGGPLAVRLT